MDWSLVLASQEIPTTILQNDPEGWALAVEAQDYDRAREAIRQFRLENRHWGWDQPIPWSDATFHWGALGWCFLLIVVHYLTWAELPSLRQAAQFDSLAVAHGQWWRTFTAILLHADLGHLLANSAIGFVLLGLALARYGAGVGLLASFLAGALGNVAGLLLHTRPYHGLGASGMVMGALGLVCIPPYRHWYSQRRAFKQVIQAIVAGVFLFLLLGVDPSSDVIAHLGGFLGGAFLSLVLHLAPTRILRRKAFVAGAWLALIGLISVSVGLAWRHAGVIRP
jgi:membrane associated rhomboid family serine protease